MEVGPLARYLIGYHQNKPEFKEPVDQLLSVLKLPKEALFSTLGRTAARALESVWAGNTLQYFFDRLMRNLKSGDTATANVTLWGTRYLAYIGKRRWFQRGAARRAGPLDKN